MRTGKAIVAGIINGGAPSPRFDSQSKIALTCSTVARGWIQVGGILAMLFGIYYIGAGIGDCLKLGAQGFYISTILGRIVLSLCFAWLAAVKAVPQTILSLAAVNLVGAFAMARALQPPPH